MRKVEKPWGYEIIWAETENYVGKVLVIEAGKRLSKQYHNLKEETVYVLEGVLLNYVDEDNVEKYCVGSSLHIKPGQVHRFGALHDRYVKVVEVSTNHLDDVVRLEDDFNRCV
tara:strand:- start:434 stop:772 length:339 start_codon:yes stop_codon:yes gene_type:complete